MVAQPPLVAPQPPGQMLDRRIEGAIGRIGVGLALQIDAAADMDVDLASVEMRLARQQHIGLDRVAEILGQDQAQAVLGMGAQRVTDVELFSSDGYLHCSGRPILVRRGTSLRCWGPRRKAGNIWRVPSEVSSARRPPSTVSSYPI